MFNYKVNVIERFFKFFLTLFNLIKARVTVDTLYSSSSGIRVQYSIVYSSQNQNYCLKLL